MKNSKKYFYIIAVYLILYFIISLNCLEIFPFVHSDEPWLSGLTRNMMESKSIYCTETFFNIYLRFPHSIKVIFHLIQMPFILVFGYNIFAVRLVSLIFSIFSLILFYCICTKIFKNGIYSVLLTILFSVNIQFIYASHFARQEIIMVFFFMLGFYHYLSPLGNKKINPHILLGLIIGLSVGIHPNSFVIAVVFGLLYIIDVFHRTKKFRNLITLIMTTGFTALIFVILSFIGDADFITHYTNFGVTLGVSSSFYDKILTIPYYYKKLYLGVSGTYYTPPIQAYLIIFAIITISSILYLLVKYLGNKNSNKKESFSALTIFRLFTCIIGINIGFIIIGRYNQTNIIFIFPFFYLLTLALICKIVEYKKELIICFMGLSIILSSYYTLKEVRLYTPYNYNGYLDELNVIPSNAKTLGNLNMEFYFDNDKLLDYRNLTFLEENNMSFRDYIDANNIEYIIYTEELDYINRNPRWNVLYGKDYYHDEMNNYIEENCTLIKEFSNSLYGIRIPRYIMEYDWKVKIYKINNIS
ncbi:ArnT family glycosyltransferase [Vallitalea guaymasensis]|uniref:ArnT family glycosyltransferase n=1 Tax=Vallitalea guaymasensis TaxID=1185412 RepID=UPI000DE21DE1|nr:glycosyltransferase family 39 protein [Vallitalea guaymasensis]